MGFEHFRVELRGGQITYAQAAEIIRRLPNIKPDRESIPLSGSTYFLMDNGSHVIELELMEATVQVSCRFTLCHPPSIDAAFLSFVRELMMRLGMKARNIEGDRPEDDRSFSLGEFTEFSAITSHWIAVRRAEWIAGFGDRTLAATTNEVYKQLILPRCTPVISQQVSPSAT